MRKVRTFRPATPAQAEVWRELCKLDEPFSINAAALALGKSPDTLRGRFREFAAKGALEKTPNGRGWRRTA